MILNLIFPGTLTMVTSDQFCSLCGLRFEKEEMLSLHECQEVKQENSDDEMIISDSELLSDNEKEDIFMPYIVKVEGSTNLEIKEENINLKSLDIKLEEKSNSYRGEFH